MSDFVLDFGELMALSNDKSFSKGEDYYVSGYVKKIAKRGNYYEGIVMGSISYKVSLDMSDGVPHFKCNCPYDFDGICKHAVAFGLAVIEGSFDNKAANIINTNQLAPEVFKVCFENADTQMKIDFLKQLLDKDTDLQSQFYKFTLNPHESKANVYFVDIDEVKEEIQDALTSIDFEDIIENYDPYGYVDYCDDESYLDDVYDAISFELNYFTKTAINFFKKGNLNDGLRILTGMYEGIQNLPKTDDAEYDIFGDSYHFEVSKLLIDEFKMAFDAFEDTVKSELHAKEAIDLLLSRYEYYNNIETDEENDAFVYNLKVFESVLISLINDTQTADYLKESLSKHKLHNSPSMAFVMMKIAETYKDEKLWIDTAEKFAEHESSIAKKLLDKYNTKSAQNNFNRIAEMAFSKWPDMFNLYLINNLDKELKKELYLKALKHYTVHNKSTKHYKILREYLTDIERLRFVNGLKTSHDLKFYINLLEIEKRFEDILSVVKAQKSYCFDYAFVLKPIINIYPDDCFEIIKNVCNDAMTSPDRKRSTYEIISSLLNVMLMIKTKQIETLQYIKALYNHKPNLPALKDEFRKHLPCIFK